MLVLKHRSEGQASDLTHSGACWGSLRRRQAGGISVPSFQGQDLPGGSFHTCQIPGFTSGVRFYLWCTSITSGPRFDIGARFYVWSPSFTSGAPLLHQVPLLYVRCPGLTSSAPVLDWCRVFCHVPGFTSGARFYVRCRHYVRRQVYGSRPVSRQAPGLRP